MYIKVCSEIIIHINILYILYLLHIIIHPVKKI